MPSISSVPGTSPSTVDGGRASVTVRRGDTLDAIARAHGTSVGALLRENPTIRNANLIYPGQVLRLPSTSAPATTPGAPPASPSTPVVDTFTPAPAPSTAWAPAPKLDAVRGGAAELARGHEGPAVKELQVRLGRAGFGVQATGKLGPTTEEALKAFQRASGIAETGRLGATTLASLLAKSTSPHLDDVRAGARVLKAPASGEDVREVQRLLGERGFPVAESAMLDAATIAAVERFQAARGLLVDGRVGKNTLRALEGGAVVANGTLPVVGHGDAWENGRRIGRIALTEIDGKRVSLETAKAFVAMRDAARQDGVELRVVSGFRDHEHQARLYDGWRRRRPGFNPAAPPGYSNHQNGRALDLNTDGSSRANGSGAVYNWLARNAQRFGFTRIPAEHWHWEYRR